MLILTADHGCDVTAEHTDHTREYVPLLAAFAGHGSRRHDGSLADVGASVLNWLTGAGCPSLPGRHSCCDGVTCPSCPKWRPSDASWLRTSRV